MMHGMDFKTVGGNKEFIEQNTISERNESTVEKKQKTEQEVIEENGSSLDAFRSNMAASTYRAPEDLAQLVSTEDIKGVKEILSQLKNAELEILKSDAIDSVKELSKQRIQMVRNKCNVKINRLSLEQKIELQVEQAKKEKDDVKSSELEEQLRRTRNARKSEEYTDVQKAMQEEQLEQQLDKYSVYEQSAFGSTYTRDIYQDMSTSGSFINMSVGSFNSAV